MNQQSSRPKKKPNPKIKQEKLNFINQLRTEIQKKDNELQELWREQLERFAAQKKQVNNAYDDMSMKVSSILSKIQTELYQVKKGNNELADKIERAQHLRSKLQTKNETTHLEVNAEYDIEIKLQQRAATLASQLGDCKRRLENATEEKIQFKKSYIRVIEQYKKMKNMDETRNAKKEALQKRMYLEKKKRELEEEKRKQIEAENDPMNKYRSLLAAAGHIKFNVNPSPTVEVAPLTQIYANEAPVTKIYQPHEIITGQGGVVIETHNNDEGIWLENNIRTLLSTGNYTDDDPVIRNLRAELARLRCF